MSENRYIFEPVSDALRKKMVFIGGARQVGKTTFALRFLSQSADSSHPAYLNWDFAPDAKLMRDGSFPANEKIVILDEIHKYARWRNLLKGHFDKEKSQRRFLVTGSARLDLLRKGGDSLVGRYRYFRLHPYSLREMSSAPNESDLRTLLHFGGFPEPLHEQDENAHRIWHRSRLALVLRDDLRSLEQVREISLIESLVDALPERVGSPLSINALREDLGVDHKTVSRWLDMLDNLYLTFRIPPYGSERIRAVKKEQKLYLWDWSGIADEGTRFENLVASQLLKTCHWIEDTRGHKMELRYLRDTSKREIDFVVLQDGIPLYAVEVKLRFKSVPPHFKYFRERTPIPRFYCVHMGSEDFEQGVFRILPFQKFVQELELP